MNVINLLENAATNAVIALSVVLYLQRQITAASDKLRDKMDSDYRELKDSLTSLSECVAKLEGMIQPQASTS